MKKPLIICDFVGTITKEDTVVAIMKKFAPPEWKRLKEKMLSEKISVKEGLEQMFSLLLSYKVYDVIEYVLSTAEIREGFQALVEYTKRNKLPLYVVSSGMDFFVKPLLKPLIPEDHIFCNNADFSGDFINIEWLHECDEHCDQHCGLCKASIIRKIASNDHYVIVIGDSITDLESAKLADIVIARDFLFEKCRQLGLNHRSFDTFYDVIHHLKQMEEVSV